LYELALLGTDEDQLEHHVVGEQDVWRVSDDLLSLFVGLLARVAGEGHGSLVVKIAVVEELPKLAVLAVGESIHLVDDDGLDAFAWSATQDVVDDGYYVGEAFARACACGENVDVPVVGGAYGF
jgi:hypothetical protein